MPNQGYIEVRTHYDAFGFPERYDYKWIGGDEVRISLCFLENANEEVHCENFPPNPGDRIKIGPFRLRTLEREFYARLDIIALRERGFITSLRIWWHQVGKVADLAYRRLIRTMALWGLARYDGAVIPSWRDVYILDRIAKRIHRCPTNPSASKDSTN